MKILLAADVISIDPSNRLVIRTSFDEHPGPVLWVEGLIHHSNSHPVRQGVDYLPVWTSPNVQLSPGGIHYSALALRRRPCRETREK
jgi:hypothetical protein